MIAMGFCLERIVDDVREDLVSRKARVSMGELLEREDRRGGASDLLGAVPERPGIIAEIKRASPSRGWIRRELDAAAVARAYREGGAWAVSVLTENRHFGGSLQDLEAVREACPDARLLRKDFLLDEYMLAESRAAGADLALLMVSVLGERTVEMVELARKHRLEPLVEVHDASELAVAARSAARLIGINNRNLRDLKVDLGTSSRLLPLVPAGAVAVVESGITGPEPVARFHAMGARLFLVGEALMDSPNPADTIRRYVGE
jgi:indole-3-glycerol phosphate synthase